MGGKAKLNVAVSRNIPFRRWCEAKGFTPVTGYELIKRGEIDTFLIGNRRYISDVEDKAFDQRTREGGQ